MQGQLAIFLTSGGSDRWHYSQTDVQADLALVLVRWQDGFNCPKAVTNPTTNWAQHRATLLINSNAKLKNNQNIMGQIYLQLYSIINYKKPYYFYQTCKAHNTYKTANIFLLV